MHMLYCHLEQKKTQILSIQSFLIHEMIRVDDLRNNQYPPLSALCQWKCGGTF